MLTSSLPTSKRRDYNIISCSQISSRLASIALNPTVRPKIVRRNLELVNTNRLILEEWVARQEGRVTWVVPNAGTTALLNLGEGSGKDGDDVKFSEELFEKTGVVSFLPVRRTEGSRCDSNFDASPFFSFDLADGRTCWTLLRRTESFEDWVRLVDRDLDGRSGAVGSLPRELAEEAR